MPNTIPTTDMASDAAFIARVNSKSKAAGGLPISVEPEQKVAIVYVPLGPGVDESHYAAIKTAIEVIAGIQNDVTLVIDGQVETRVPDGFHWVLNTESAFRLEPIPAE